MPKYASVREMRYLRYDKIYTSNIRLKKSRKAGQKQTPQEFCGDLFIPGGSKGIRTPGSVGRVHDVFIFIATVAILFLATQKPDLRLF